MDDPLLASLSLTHVRYNPADHWSYVSAWLALVPQALCVIYVTLIWATREVEVLLMFTGQMSCELLNFGLKRWIREDRPQQMHGKGYGMPSSHAQFVSFFAVSLALFLLLRHQPSTQHHHNSLPRSSTIPGKTSTATNNFDPLIYPTYRQSSLLERLVLSLLAICGATAVAASRIYLSYHTPRQVLVGVIAGILFALLWFMGTSWLRTEGWVEWGLDTYLARLVRLRDLIVTEDLQDAGWGRWEARRRIMVKGKRT